MAQVAKKSQFKEKLLRPAKPGSDGTGEAGDALGPRPVACARVTTPFPAAVPAPYSLRRLNHGLSFGGRELPPCKGRWPSESRLRFAIRDVRNGQLRALAFERLVLELADDHQLFVMDRKGTSIREPAFEGYP